jgi:hypothetical protein
MTTARRIAQESWRQQLPTGVDEWPPHLQRMNQEDVDLRGEARYDRTTARVCASIRTTSYGLAQQ